MHCRTCRKVGGADGGRVDVFESRQEGLLKELLTEEVVVHELGGVVGRRGGESGRDGGGGWGGEDRGRHRITRGSGGGGQPSFTGGDTNIRNMLSSLRKKHHTLRLNPIIEVASGLALTDPDRCWLRLVAIVLPLFLLRIFDVDGQTLGD